MKQFALEAWAQWRRAPRVGAFDVAQFRAKMAGILFASFVLMCVIGTVPGAPCAGRRPKPAGIAHCVVGDVRLSPNPRFRPAIIDALAGNAASSSVFAVLGVGCHGRALENWLRNRTRCVAASEGALAPTLEMLRDLLVHVEVLREGEAGSRAGPPGHRCVWGSADASSGYSQWLKVQRCFDAVKAFEEEHCVRFSHVVRSRPDLQSVGPQPLPPISALPNDTISVQTKEARKVDDRFAVVPRALADVYFGAVGSYFTCRTCKYYHDHCWPHSRLKKGRAFCNRSKHAQAALTRVEEGLAAQDHHVSSECLLGSWLFDHGVRATPGPERFEDKWLVAVRRPRCNRADCFDPLDAARLGERERGELRPWRRRATWRAPTSDRPPYPYVPHRPGGS